MRNLFFAILLSASILSSGCNNGISVGNEKSNLMSFRGRAIEIVLEGLNDSDNSIKSNAIEVVSQANIQELLPQVVKLLDSQSVAVRFAATVAIGDMNYRAGNKPVKKLLSDENENIKIAAAYSLTKLGNNDYSDTIRKSIKNNDQTVRANSALLLGKLGNRDDLEILYWVMQDPYSFHKVKVNTVEAIATLGDDRIYRNKLWPLLISKFADDRIMGISGMAALNTPDSKDAIITMLDDALPEVRLYAAEQLGRIGDKTGEPEVLDYFENVAGKMDTEARQRNNVLAAMAIGRIGSERLNKFLPELLQSQSKQVRLSAAGAVLLLISS